MSINQIVSTNRKLVYNGIQCLECSQLIESTHRHDYVTCKCPNAAMVDGGLEYARYGAVNMSKIRHLQKYADESIDRVRGWAFRFNQKGRVIRLSKMSTNWLDNAIEFCIDRKGEEYSPTWHTILLIKEQQYRIENEIYVDDTQIKGRDYIDVS